MATTHKQIRDDRIVGHQGLGLIQIFEGHGKGKTTAALGLAVRMVGAGHKVAVVYFDKGGTHYSERDAIEKYLSDMIEVHGTGRDRIDAMGRFDFTITEVDKEEGARGIEIVRELMKRVDIKMIILDEINSSVDLGIVKEKDVLELIECKHPDMELVLTGRNAPQSFRGAAHLVTEMTLQKHYFYSGVKARVGVDY